MPEIKHTFQAGKMNKDLDERLVPNGEYRDALNIQVRTTSGDAIGTVQNIKGTAEVGSSYYAAVNNSWMDDTPPINIASIADERNDKAYFFFSSPKLDLSDFTNISSERIYVDSIIQQDVNSGATTPVVVDRYAVFNISSEVLDFEIYDPNNYTGTWTSFDVIDGSKYRVGMTIRALTNDGDDLFLTAIEENFGSLYGDNGATIKAINGNTITLYEGQTTNFLNVGYFVFQAPRVLNFGVTQITGINIVDDLLFWTDNHSEPKKINISRCISGTASDPVVDSDYSTHTQLHVKDVMESGELGDEQYSLISDVDQGLAGFPNNSDLKEEHITVIRKAPRTAPTLHMKKTDREDNTVVDISGYYFTTSTSIEIEIGNIKSISDTTNAFLNSDFRKDDILNITQNPITDVSARMKAKFLCYEDALGNEVSEVTNTIRIRMLQITAVDLTPLDEWNFSLELRKPLFELKLARFGYRYKYEDGEYSSFSPWSEVAFLPEPFDYSIKKAYNLGMVNSVRELIIKDFIPYKIPLDVVGVDILYKTTDSPNVYVVKTVNKTTDAEWELFTPGNFNETEIKTGQLAITSEMIHSVLPSNQLFRSWDNVPRRALAQEITGNRLVYGNYLQGYPTLSSVSLTQAILSEDTATVDFPKPSIKSIRNYKFGMVFGDKYGRETPVISSGYTTDVSGDFTALTGDLVIEKSLAKMKNTFELRQDWASIASSDNVGGPPLWIDYVKYYVKETSNEYYNLIMDRWYWASEAQENIWISFNSADRNKVDEETYLILKNRHGTDTPVESSARFKIIAIENEAPDFIKTRLNNIDEVEITAANTTPILDVDDPDDLESTRKIEITGEDWLETIGGPLLPETSMHMVWGRPLEGSVKFRLKGKSTAGDIMYTGWKWVTSYRMIIDDYTEEFTDLFDRIEIKWDDPFGDEADFYERFNESGIDVSTPPKYYMEFKEAIVENKPEFDGKFFVKLEALEDLRQNIGAGTGVEANYVTDQAFSLRYISSSYQNEGNPAGGTTASYNFAGTTFDSDSAISTAMGGGAWYFGYFEDWGDHALITSDNEIQDATLGFGGCLDCDGADCLQVVANAAVKNFWQTFQQSTAPGVFKVFIDSVRARHLRYSDNTGGDYFKPSSFAPGGASVGMGEMTLSVSEPFPPQEIGGVNAFQLFNGFMEPGQYFRFSSDPNGEVYVIETVAKSDYGQLGSLQPTNWSDPEANCKPCNYSATLTDDIIGLPGVGNVLNLLDYSCKRHSYKVTFKRLLAGGNPSTEGLIPSEYDPRSHLRHDGGTSSTSIQFVLQDTVGGEGGILVSNPACWETEPKDDTDLEVYYEASNAIPTRINEDNAFDFAPINSTIKLRRQDSGGIDDVELQDEQHRVSNIYFTNDTPIIEIKSYNAALGTTSLHDEDIVIGDLLVFEHNDGSQTTSSILNHYYSSDTTITSSSPFIESPEITAILTKTESGSPPQVLIGISNVSIPFEEFVSLLPLYVQNSANTLDNVYISEYLGSGNVQVVGGTDFLELDVPYNIKPFKRTGYYEVDPDVYQFPVKLSWYNCYSFGNGVESDRIRDDFNAPQLDNGVKVSTTFSGYSEERIGSGMIYSGLYNSTSQVNNLNEFNTSQKITKELNPSYGSIQALKTRDTDVVVFTEDKVLKVLSNKDAVYNADGDVQLTSTNRVLGTAVPFAGDYGISKNPESLAWDQYRMYFTDKQRGAALRLSMDGLTPISNVGMKTWFRDNLKRCDQILGTFDTVNGEYNVTLTYNSIYQNNYNNKTVSFNEGAKGWVSFKSIVPQAGVSVSGKYITAVNHRIWEHYRDVDLAGATIDYNTFYGTKYDSSVQVLFNDSPSSVKSFKTMNYEGSQAKINQSYDISTATTVTDTVGNSISTNDGRYDNLTAKTGWYVDSFETDMQSGKVPEFINKENKWFNKIHGITTSLTNLDENEFTVQGIGIPTAVTLTDVVLEQFTFTVQNWEDPDDSSESIATTNTTTTYPGG